MDGRMSFNVSSFCERRGTKTGLFVKHECPWWQRSPKLAIFSINFTVKVTRSVTLVSFERLSLVEYACQLWSLYLLRLKFMAKVKVFFLPQSDRVTDRTKTRCPRIPLRGHKKQYIHVHLSAYQAGKIIYNTTMFRLSSWFLLAHTVSCAEISSVL